MSKQLTSSGGIGVGMILFLIFLVLKLTNHIDWSWWWVTLPLWWWIPVVLIIWLIMFLLQKYFKGMSSYLK